jgi:hypothetical protein
MATLETPEFLARSAALEARLREVLPEYALLYGQYEDVRNAAVRENNPVPGGAAEFNNAAADALENQLDTAFAGIMNAVEQICAVNNPVNNGNGNNMRGGRKLRKRTKRTRKTRRTK